MQKKTYYVSVATHEISQIPYGNNADFKIEATSDDVRILRAKLDNMHNADRGSFWRAHVPIMLYHNDEANDTYDTEITGVFQMLYDLGDEQAQSHIESMGILSDRHM